jgi:hydrogenase nickel incorporation protein HypA/HybF
MHETFLAARLIEQLEELTGEHQPCRLTRVKLRVGALQQVAPDLLHFAFDAASGGTVAEGAELQIEPAPAACRCGECGAAFEVSDWCYLCPSCESASVELQGGDEFVIETMTLEEVGSCESRVSSEQDHSLADS